MPSTQFRIVPKRDFPCVHGMRGFYDRGRWITKGFVVTDGVCNIMPGATWFETIPEALKAIEIFCGVQGDAKAFWAAWGTVQ